MKIRVAQGLGKGAYVVSRDEKAKLEKERVKFTYAKISPNLVCLHLTSWVSLEVSLSHPRLKSSSPMATNGSTYGPNRDGVLLPPHGAVDALPARLRTCQFQYLTDDGEVFLAPAAIPSSFTALMELSLAPPTLQRCSDAALRKRTCRLAVMHCSKADDAVKTLSK